MKSSGYFVAGTDTGVGKTSVTCGLVNGFNRLGTRAGGMKPVFSGLMSDDIHHIAAVSSYSPGFAGLCTYHLTAPVAPFIAAKEDGKRIEIAPIMSDYARCKAIQAVTVVEGTGGWLCPINSAETMADVARALELPVILVVGLRLGCLNHALLSAEAIRQSGLALAGWVANAIDPHFTSLSDNVDYLEQHLNAPLLAQLRFAPQLSARDLSLEQAARWLSC